MAAITTAPVSSLMRVGYSYRGATLLTQSAAIDWKVALRRGAIPYRQAKYLMTAPTLTMAGMLRNGFTRHQAKTILGL